MDASEIQIRVGTPDDWEAISDLLGRAFHETISAEQRELEGSVFEPERSLVADDDGLVAGHAAAFTRDLSVPGGAVPAAFVSMVGVAATHRRQGVLTRLMRRQLADVAAAGREPIAVLWASEGRIYQRFGYGLASQRLTLQVPLSDIRPPLTPPMPGAKLRMVEPMNAVAELAKVYEQLRLDRPGYAGRDDRWWRYVLADPESQRDGMTRMYGVVHDTPQGPTGYAIWRVKDGWDETGPGATVRPKEVVAADPVTYAALWRFLLSTDLARTAVFHFATPDEPLFHLVDEPRRLGGRMQDGLWVRIVDVGRALASRRYATDVDVVLDVTDALLPQNTGRWRLTARAAGVTCRPTDDPADLACTTLELGAVYLGGPTLGALAAAGRVREVTAGTLAPASTAFGWDRLPQAIEMF